MQRLWLVAITMILVFSCKQKEQDNLVDVVTQFEINGKEWPKKLVLNSKVKPNLKGWKEFETLETSFDALYKVENTEELTLAIDDLIKGQKGLAESRYPTKFDMPQIKGRLTMFKTFLLKVKGDLHYRLDVQKSTLEMVNAYNAFRNQFNIIANNTLDTRLLIEE